MKKLESPLILDATMLVIIDGNECQTLANFYQIISNQLNFPNYFSHTLDSLDEMISDLSWVNQEKIIIIISNYNIFLEEEAEEIKAIINDIFENTETENNIINFNCYYQ